MNGWLVFLLLLNAYFLLLFILVRTGWINRLGMSLFGPALMLKTQRGRGLLDWFARARGLFDIGAGVGVYLTYSIMFLLSLFLVWQLTFIFEIPPELVPSARLILGIPGVNPIIPIGYGIVALIFAVVVHEFSHGILARVHGLQVKTMGLLFLVIPIGAFVEPDEEALKAAPRRTRIKVFSAGPTSNLFFALFFATLFSPVLMASVDPVPGVPMFTVEADGPACRAGILPGWVLTHVNEGGPERDTARPLEGPADFTRLLNNTPAGATIHFFARASDVAPDEQAHACRNETNDAAGVYSVTTVPCSQQYEESACIQSGAAAGHADPQNRSVMGVSPYPHDAIQGVLEYPIQSLPAFGYYLAMPFSALEGQFPLAGAFQDFYEVPFHPPTFWVLANTLYWLFWINLMLGLTNALPILPMDGGHMFRDLVGGWLQRASPNMAPERRDAVIRRVSLTVTFVILSLILLQFVGPQLARLF